MNEYSVEITDTAYAAILKEMGPSRRWFEVIRDALGSLARLPRRAPKAQEDDYVPYEVRQVALGSHLMLFTIDEDHRKVIVIGLRPVRKIPLPQDLRRNPFSVNEEDGG